MKLNHTNKNLNALMTLALLLLFGLKAQSQQFMGGGCAMQTYAPFNFFVDYQNKTTGRFGNVSTDLPPVTVEGCKSATGQFLAFGLALRKPALASDISDVSFDGVLKPDLCTIENAPIPLQTFEEKKKVFEEQFQLLRKCVKIEITHLEQKPIQFNPNQKLCTLTRITPFKLEAKGDMCFLPITPDLRVALGVVVDKNCANEDFLKQNNIQIADIEAVLNGYVVPTDTGDYINNQIGSQKVRVAVLPSSKIMPIYEGVTPGGPRFPTEYAPNVYMGQVTIKDDSRGEEERTYVEMKVFVDNKSQRKCADGLCAGPGDYQVPLAAEVELFEVVNGKKKHVDSWYTGNVFDPFVKAQWQGVYSFGKRIIENYKMVEGAEYEIALNFYNPYDDFLLLTNSFDQLLVDTTHMNGTAGLDSIRPVSPISPIGKMPLLNSLPPLGVVDDVNKEFEKVRQFFKSMGSEVQFPPIYDFICDNKSGKCEKSGRRGFYLKLSTRFTLGGVNDEDLSFKFVNKTIQKESTLHEAYKKQTETYPEYKCGYSY